MERLTKSGTIGSDKYYEAIGFSAIEQRPFFYLIKRLAEYENTGLTPEEITNLHASCNIDVGQKVYVITQYSKLSDYEIIESTVDRKTVKSRKTFSVSGRYKNDNFYNGTFVDSSVGRTVFLTRKDAEEKLKSNKF